MMLKKSFDSPNPHFTYDEDDIPIGRLYSRREALKLFAATTGVLMISGCRRINNAGLDAINADLPIGCVVRPEMAEGPLFVDNELDRSDIRSDPATGKLSAGAPLTLAFNISALAAAACTPLSNVKVDLWQCDAEGIYSDTDDLGFQTVGQKFLRGWQRTDANGNVQFTTIYPGWYQGRAVHIHFKIRTDDGYDFTSQLFFDEAMTDSVYAQAPYNSRGERIIRNEDDGIYRSGGEQMILAVQQSADGYAATFDVTLDLS